MFYGRRSFKGLQEALDVLMAQNSDEETDLIIIPPDLDELTDNEEIDEETLHDESIPNDVPGEVEIEVSAVEPSPTLLSQTLEEDTISKNYFSIGIISVPLFMLFLLYSFFFFGL